MTNIGYRTFNGTTDEAQVTLGNIASQSSLDTWVFAGRILSGGAAAGGVIIDSPGFDPLDFFLNQADAEYNLYDGATGTSGHGHGNPAYSVADGFVIIAFRRVSATVLRWSKAIYSGSWGAFTHSNGTDTFGNRTYASSGNLKVSDLVAPCNMDVALIARGPASLSDANINTLTTDLPAWQALSFTNLWRFDGGSIVDSKGTSVQSSITGTSVTAAGFPLDAGAAAASSLILPRRRQLFQRGLITR